MQGTGQKEHGTDMVLSSTEQSAGLQGDPELSPCCGRDAVLPGEDRTGTYRARTRTCTWHKQHPPLAGGAFPGHFSNEAHKVASED